MSFHSRRFGRAADTYEAHSQVQASMADTLLAMLPGAFTLAPGSAIIELGCGTGLLTRRLRDRFPSARLLATDASDRMLETGRLQWHAAARTRPPAPAGTAEPPPGGPTWLVLDASGQAPVPETVSGAGPFGLAASNALVQWFPDLRPHFAWVAARLAAHGSYLVSGFTPGNFPEMNAILRAPPFAYRSFPGNTEADVAGSAAAAGLKLETWRAAETIMRFPSPEAFLAAIRALGSARRPESGNPLTRSKLAHLVDTYRERYGDAEGVRVTWCPWSAWLRKA
jgi:malonyl-CoA O-methyltransferase